MNMRIAKIGNVVWGMMLYLSVKFEPDLTSHSEVMYTNMSKFGEFSQIFRKNRPIFLLKIVILKIPKHGQVAVDVCFYEKNTIPVI